jgi:16S rRNA (cytidine1402-2'-O)-methyltransferase
MTSSIYLVPCILAENATDCIPTYVMDAVKKCQVIFAENERTARRFFKSMEKSIVIDDYQWYTIGKAEDEQIYDFKNCIAEGKTIAIVSEAGCPGVADPGQKLIAEAQKLHCKIHPLVGPSSILLALMASGMNGQQFEFVGYLPIENNDRAKKLKELELSSQKNNSTKIFIETPYRNNALLESILKTCNPSTMLCIAVNITADNETIHTLTVKNWVQKKLDMHKQPAIFLLYSGN